MPILSKIAIRNVLANKKRSFLIGFAIFFSTFILMLANAVINGIEKQVMRGYINYQCGHVAVMWEETKKVNNMDPGKFFYGLSYDVEKNDENQKALARFRKFLKKHRREITAFFPTVRQSGYLQFGQTNEYVLSFGLTSEDKDFLLSSKTLTLTEGAILPPGEDYTICISQEKANDTGAAIGDVVSLEVTTPYGAKNSLDFNVSGIYANGAGYDNHYGFISDQNMRELYDVDPEFFDLGRIYLKDPSQATVFARELDRYLTRESKVLRAEDYAQASPFYTNNARNYKVFFNVFVCVLLAIIAIGLRTTIRMNLFERMKEFGTIRAIGYSRFQSYAIIFLELFFLSLLSFAAAFLLSTILILALSYTGIYVGSGGLSYALGGESLYPSFKWGDILSTFIIIILFSLFSTLNPGVKLCFQKITDLMVKRPKKFFLLLELWRSLRIILQKNLERESVKC